MRSQWRPTHTPSRVTNDSPSASSPRRAIASAVEAATRTPTSNDACSLETLDGAFTRENQNLRELLVALTQNDAFLYLPEVTP